jgi:alkanesulfonate monooxygenase SsuD/methylene tetrahydromethanopterin reductase-like flavin-dependent oxidoreductase (luciferase family)
MALELGVFVVPDATDLGRTMEQVRLADELGLDLVGIQDHPYQRRFLDTWTLLAYLAGRTSSIRLVPDVANLPLRLPAPLAKAAASLDLLSGGRLELGLGAGAFWDGIVAMGGPRRTPKESVDALEEAIAILQRSGAATTRCASMASTTRSAGCTRGRRPRTRSGSGSGPTDHACCA